MSTQNIEALLETIYFAAATGGTWQSAIDELGALMPSVAFALYGHDFTTNRSLGELHAGYDPRAIEQYNTYYAGVSPWAKGFMASPVNQFLHSDNFLPRADLINTEYYNDWLRPQQQIVGYGSLLANDKGRFLAFSTTVRAQDEAAIEADLSRLVRALMPHLQQAFKLSRTISEVPASKEADSLVGLISDPAVLLDAKSRILYANEGAACMFGTDELLSSVQGKLHFNDAAANLRLRRQMHAIESRAYDCTGEIVTRAPKGRLFSCLLTPLISMNSPQPIRHFIHPAVSVLLVFKEKKASLAEYYQLSAGEADVVNKLVAGSTLKEISRLRGTSLETVRTQLRHALAKLDVHRQSELVAKVLNEQKFLKL